MTDRLKEYKIAYRGLTEGTHIYTYSLDSTFWGCFEATRELDANIEAQVEITKSALLMKVKITEKGEVRTICDRCLEPCNLHLEGELELFVKNGSRESGNDDDYIVLGPDEDYLDLSSYLYETYMLNYPIRVVHEEGECDDEMRTYIHDDDNKPDDPRWDDLKKLINN